MESCMFGIWKISKIKKEDLVTRGKTFSGNGHSNHPNDGDPATETVAKMLRILGRHAFDLDKADAESIGKEFERWARHVLLGISPSETPDSREQNKEGKRNWGEVSHFVNRHRQQEKEYVVQGFQSLREMIWTFVKTLSQAFLHDKDTDSQMRSHIGRLKAVVEGNSLDEVKREVLAAAQGLSKLVEDRSQQDRQRLDMLGAKLKEVKQELGIARKQMTLDPLTHLYNRAALDQQIECVRALNILSEAPACLLMVDIDHFKRINDTYGHRAGDAVIRELADRTVLNFPRRNDFVARYGGEEFAVLLQGDGRKVGQTLGERLLLAVRDVPFCHESVELQVTVSIGLAELVPGETAGSWVERADRALYAAKEGGRNQLCLSIPESSQSN